MGANDLNHDSTGVYAYEKAISGWRIERGARYKNTKTGHVYLATASVSFKKSSVYNKVYIKELKYDRTDIIAVPNLVVQNLSFVRKGTKYTVSWKIPSEATAKTNNARAESVSVRVWVHLLSDGKWHLYDIPTDIGVGATSFSFDRNGYPRTYLVNNVLIGPADYLKAEIWTINSKGKSKSSNSCRFSFYKPKKPVFSDLRQDVSTGVVSCKYTLQKNDTDGFEVYDAKYWTTVYRSNRNAKTISQAQTSTANTGTLTVDVADRQEIPYEEYVMVTFFCESRGFSGRSDTAQIDYYISFPYQPTISMKFSTNTPLYSSRTTISISTKHSTTHPVTGVRIQKLVSVDYDSASQIPGNADWEDISVSDDGQCTAISLATEELIPEAGKKTWIRAKSWNDIESIFYRYSVPLRMTQLETPAPVEPTAGNDYAYILSCKAGDDGQSAQLLVGWDKDGTDDSNWTEISWATSEKAWRSTRQPDTFLFADQSWNEGQVTSGGTTYRKSAHIDIMELEAGQKYFIAARRVLRPDDGETTYGPYSTKVSFTPSDLSEAPDSITLSADATVIRGEAIPMFWSYNGAAPQSSWVIRKMLGSSPSISDIVLASGNDERHFHNLPYYRDEARTSAIASSTATSIRLYVECVIVGVQVSSAPVTVGFLDRPSFEVSAPEVLLTKPAIITAFTNDATAEVSVSVVSDGISGQGPDGSGEQPSGDTVWSGTIRPQWEVVSSIAEQTEVEEAKEDLDAAQEAFDQAMSQYEEVLGRKNSARDTIATLEVTIPSEQRDLANAQADLVGCQTRLENMDEDDPLYEIAVAEVESATEMVQALQERLADDLQAMEDAQAELDSDSDKYPRVISSLTAKGHAEQASTTGKNLLAPYTVSNSNVRRNADGSVTIVSLPSSNQLFAVGRISLVGGQSYVLSGAISNASYMYVTVDGTNKSDTGNSVALTPSADQTENINCVITPNSVVGTTFYPQLEAGSTATSYEPYTGGAPSPSPDYPQEIQVVSGHTVTGKTGRFVDLVVKQGNTTLSTTPIPLPQRGWVAGLPDGTADKLRLDGAGKVEWTEATEERAVTLGDSVYTVNGMHGAVWGTSSFIGQGVVSLLCDKAIKVDAAIATNGNMYKNPINVMFLGDADDTLADLKAKYDGATVLYPLITPITEDCGYVDMPAIPSDATVTIPELDALGIKYEFDWHYSNALEEAIQAYASAVADAIGPSEIGSITHKATITLPDEMELVDNGTYTVRAFATNTETNISSYDDTCQLLASWSHQAPVPSPDIKVYDRDETDDNGYRTLGTRIELSEPTRAYQTDVYDIYRVTRDGTHIALQNVPQDAIVHDDYAPFGLQQNAYAIACRTANGDVDWMEYRYTLNAVDTMFESMVRIDWNGKYVELERNVEPSDSFEKDFESHKHLDGTVSGHWNVGTMRTMRISAAIVRGYEVEQERLLRELARYDGPCLVRTTDGIMVEGNVSVDDISFRGKTVRGDVSLSVTEITPTGTFAPTIVEEE